MLRAWGYFHGGLESQRPHLRVELWPGLRNCRLNPNRPFLSSAKWIISPPVTLWGWGPKGGSGREWALPPLASSQGDFQTDLGKEKKIKARSRPSNLLLTGFGCLTSSGSIPSWVLVMMLMGELYVGCLSLSSGSLEFSEPVPKVGQSHVIPGLVEMPKKELGGWYPWWSYILCGYQV